MRRGAIALSGMAVLLLTGTAIAQLREETVAPIPTQMDGLTVKVGTGKGVPATKRPYHPWRKPAYTRLGAGDESDQIIVKFQEGTGARARSNSVVSDTGANLKEWKATLAKYPSATVRPYFADLPEEAIMKFQANAAANTTETLSDLNLFLLLTIPELRAKKKDAEALLNALNALPIVEIAQFQPKPMPPPGMFDGIQSVIDAVIQVPDYTAQQQYRGAQGVNSSAVQATGAAGSNGEGITVYDHEYSMNFKHRELKLSNSALIIGPGAKSTDPFSNTDHGTAVAGELVAKADGAGTVGMVTGATLKFAPVKTDKSGMNIALALLRSALDGKTGDLYLIEQQMAGPNFTGVPAGTQVGLVPVEWLKVTQATIKLITWVGGIVVEAAGNGSQNLDAAAYAGLFTPGNANFKDSGAILVGAGAATGANARARLAFSNYGNRLNVQGWGQTITTTGYGDLFNGNDNTKFTNKFGGTSGASPMITGAAAILQGMYTAQCGAPLKAEAMQTFLLQNAQPQKFLTDAAGNVLNQPIGPLPDLSKIVLACLGDGDNAAF